MYMSQLLGWSMDEVYVFCSASSPGAPGPEYPRVLHRQGRPCEEARGLVPKMALLGIPYPVSSRSELGATGDCGGIGISRGGQGRSRVVIVCVSTCDILH